MKKLVKLLAVAVVLVLAASPAAAAEPGDPPGTQTAEVVVGALVKHGATAAGGAIGGFVGGPAGAGVGAVIGKVAGAVLAQEVKPFVGPGMRAAAEAGGWMSRKTRSIW